MSGRRLVDAEGNLQGGGYSKLHIRTSISEPVLGGQKMQWDWQVTSVTYNIDTALYTRMFLSSSRWACQHLGDITY